ncbi:MAG: class I SAM-dependent methyltransferase [Planctomycetota bacterium]
MPTETLTIVDAPQACCDDTWEAAYERFETPQQEVAKFRGRLRWFGAHRWERSLRVVELFCGRGNGLVAWRQLGFENLEGADLSEQLLRQYDGPAKCYVADCRKLPFEDGTRDVISVHGGLHHLPDLPADVAQTLDEASRVLRPGGRLLVVEPWNTPFLHLVHGLSAQPMARRAWSKLDAFQQLYEHEQATYDNWRSRPEELLGLFEDRFEIERLSTTWGKLRLLGRKR